MTDRGDVPTVLLVDDQSALVEMYGLFLGDEYDVVTATDGEEMLERIDESIDAVVLDRRMPGMTGDEALVTLRERGYGIPIAMISAVHPGSDIVGLPLDAYLTKPVDRERLRKLAELLVARRGIDGRPRSLLRLASKKAALETAGYGSADGSAIKELGRRMDAVRAEMGDGSEHAASSGPAVDIRDIVGS